MAERECYLDELKSQFNYFWKSGRPSAWISGGDDCVMFYVRKPMDSDGFLHIATITIEKPFRRVGIFKHMLQWFEEHSAIKKIKVENVMEEWFRQFFLRNGFESDSMPMFPSFYKVIQKP